MAEAQKFSKPKGQGFLSIYAPVILITIIGLVIAYQFVQPAPPKRFLIATGSEQGAYYQFARRYQEILARHGIELDIRTTAGSTQNIELLRSPTEDVPVAFVQSGVASPEPSDHLVALASLYYEPLWLFYRGEATMELVSDLRGKRVAVGSEGSGTRAMVLRTLKESNLTHGAITILSLGNAAASEALKRGEIDAAFFIAAPQSSLIKDLFTADGVRLMHFRRANAYSRQWPFLALITLPEGVIDLERGIPPQDVSLVAPTATLICRDDFHPALIDLLLQAATLVHRGSGSFEDAGQFPSTKNLDFPLSTDARRFFKYGPPFLQRFLPFWAATMVDRLKIMLLPLFFLLLPLVKVVPPLYTWRIRSRIYRWYEELQAVDHELHGASKKDFAPLQAEVKRIEDQVLKISVPLSYARELYNLRLHIALIQGKLRDLQSGLNS